MKQLSKATIPTDYGKFTIAAFGERGDEYSPHLAIIGEPLDVEKPVNIRIHSECVTGDIFGSHRCECGEQLHAALKAIGMSGGVVIYLRQEGRGIGIINKLKAYELQDQGLDTVEANIHLGFEPDERQYDTAIEIMHLLGIKSIYLLTNNPDKLSAIEESDIELVGRKALIIPTRESNKSYMKTKENYFGHML